jgi:hypothetical protein
MIEPLRIALLSERPPEFMIPKIVRESALSDQ